MKRKMKRIINFAIIAAAALLAFAGCVKEQGYDTDQYGSAPTLSAFAPNPVFRGGELTFLGSNLEQVTSRTPPRKWAWSSSPARTEPC